MLKGGKLWAMTPKAHKHWATTPLAVDWVGPEGRAGRGEGEELRTLPEELLQAIAQNNL